MLTFFFFGDNVPDVNAAIEVVVDDGALDVVATKVVDIGTWVDGVVVVESNVVAVEVEDEEDVLVEVDVGNVVLVLVVVNIVDVVDVFVFVVVLVVVVVAINIKLV